MENKEPDLLPELVDIKNRVKAYNLAHPDGCFVFRFVGYKKSGEQCPDCGGDDCMCEYDESKSELGIFGDIETVRNMLNELRDIAEDNVTRQGMVIV
jgi:hypothetical protein